MKIIKEDIEKSICDYNKSIKKLEDAGIDYGDYTVTIHHTRWIKLLTLLKTHIEAWEKVRAEIENLYEYPSRDDYIHQEETRAFIDKSEVLDIIDKYRESEDKE